MKQFLCSIFLFLFFTSVQSGFAQIDDTPDQPNEKAPAPEGIEPVIPLNVDDPTYDLWKLKRDDLSEGRDPGLINVQRFWGGFGWQGIPTFVRLPVIKAI